MEEREFFAGEHVYVSLTRFVVFGQTYAMSSVASVKAHTVSPSRVLPVIAILVAFMCVLVGGNGIIYGFLMLAIGGALWALQKPEHVILLSTSSGEVQTLRSQDRQYISAVVQALNDCIVARG